ncbi:substrate-binding domain-containing protein [Neobacillus drentensis]|uniref:substrate-binding domain-containing protein n=1 Tax=Neobacillus drentensis TaxID=220684 RepID=UPI002FFEB2FF
MKKITMQDIADKLQISKNSVSQALGGKKGVSIETKELVMKTANELGYQYREKKRKISQTPAKSIALIASDFAFSQRGFFGEIYLSVDKEATIANCNILVQSINNQQKESLTLPQIIQQSQVDGIIILSHISDKYIDKVINTGIPTVIIDHHYPNVQADCILTNNRFGAFQAIQHLIELNHQDIGFIGNTGISPSYEERLEGYYLALKKYGITPNPKFIMSTMNESEENVFTYLHSLEKQPSAWFCVNDGLSFYVSSYLQQNNFHIPNDISVCGYDNGELSKLANPKITTLDIDLHYYGECALNQLLWRLENKSAPFREILLPSTLLKRESTGLAPYK